MQHFWVWAPGARAVDLVLGDDTRRAMRKDGDTGGWSVAVAEAGPGTRYAFSVDGGPPRPDPRSASQPDGVHGFSEVVDHAAFAWGDHGWRGLPLRGAVLYELHVGTFTAEGTFDAAIERLPHLVDLGVDAIELLPVASFSGERGWGYDGVDLFAPHAAYGGPDGLKRLVDACHAAGLGVVMDVVYNHLGPSGNYLAELGPYFTPHHRTNWGDGVNFDGPHSDEVRRFVIDNACMWLRDYHCDGLRLDAVHAIADESALHVLEQLTSEVRALSAQLHRPLFVIAESDRNDPRLVRPPQAGGYGMDAAWADEWHHALHAVLAGETDGYYEDFGSLANLAKALRQAWVYDGVYSPHRQRTHGRSPEGLSGDQFVVCAQNHDQVGNRAGGERLSQLTTPGRLRIAAALLLTGPFTPLLFQGEEWAASSPFQYFTDHPDPELARAVSEGRRSEFAAFGWTPDDVPDPQAEMTFLRSKLDWSELARPPHADMLAWYEQLIALRRRQPALRDPRLSRVRVRYDEGEGWLLVVREPITVAINLGPRDVELPVTPGSKLICGSTPAVQTRHDHTVALPADSVGILEHPRG